MITSVIVGHGTVDLGGWMRYRLACGHQWWHRSTDWPDTAKLHMIQSAGAYKKPYYWAPFQVYTRTGGRPTSK